MNKGLGDTVTGNIYRKRHRRTGELMDESRVYLCVPDGQLGNTHIVKVTTAAEHEVAPASFELVRRHGRNCAAHKSLGTDTVERDKFNATITT